MGTTLKSNFQNRFSVIAFGLVSLILFSAEIRKSEQVKKVSGKFYNNFQLCNYFDLGENGIGIATYDIKYGAIIKNISSSGEVKWETQIPHYGRQAVKYNFAASKNGDFIYAINGNRPNYEGGCKQLFITTIDVKTGVKTLSEFSTQYYGHIYMMYCNANYLFILTTKYLFDDERFSRDPGLQLLRFDNSKKLLDILPHQMSFPENKDRIFWTPIDITDEYVLTYKVNKINDYGLEIATAKFDYNGKLLDSIISTINLNSKPIISGCDGSFSPGICWQQQPYNSYIPGLSATTVSSLHVPIRNMSYCNFAYNAKFKCYYVYGLVGKESKETKGGDHCTGFFIVQFDSTGRVKNWTEQNEDPLLRSDNVFSEQAIGLNRTISLYFSPDEAELSIIASAFTTGVVATSSQLIFNMDASKLSLLNSYGGNRDEYEREGRFFIDHNSSLIYNPDVQSNIEELKYQHRVMFMATRTSQYVAMYSIPGKEITIYSKQH